MSQHRDCTVVNLQLEAYVDGEVSSLEAKMISAHIEMCGACAAEYESVLAVKEVLHGLPHFEGSENMPRLDEVRHSTHLRRRQVMLSLAAGVLITFILFPFIGKTLLDKPDQATVDRSTRRCNGSDVIKRNS